MDHHSDRPFPEVPGLGPTGKYPQGKLNPDDEGELRIAVGVQSSKVVMDFGKPTTWFACDPQTALALADCLRARAHSIIAASQESDGKRKTVCVDLDAVLAHYEGWKGHDHIGDPRPGAVQFTHKLREFAQVVVYTTRCKADPGLGRPDGATGETLAAFVQAWLTRHQFAFDEVYCGQGKPFFAALVDDRAVPIRANPSEQDFAAAIDAARILCSA